MRAPLVIVVLIAVIASGCGLRFVARFSMNDKYFFSEPPRVIVKGDAYTLRWRFGEGEFFFQPSSKVVDGKLLFALQGTASSGSVADRYFELPIDDPKQIHALESGGVFWVEPDGRMLPLEIVKE